MSCNHVADLTAVSKKHWAAVSELLHTKDRGTKFSEAHALKSHRCSSTTDSMPQTLRTTGRYQLLTPYQKYSKNLHYLGFVSTSQTV